MVDLLVENRKLSGVDLAIFDKDGTLIDVHCYWSNMIGFRAEELAGRLGLGPEEQQGLMESMGVDTTRMKIKPEGPVGIKKREIVLQAGVDYLMSRGYPDSTDAFVEAFRLVDERSMGQLSAIVKPLPGLNELIDGLSRAGCKIAIATTDRTGRAGAAMHHLGLAERIDLIVGADGVHRPKPDPEIVDTICRRLGIAPERSIMVGDSASDVKCGLNAGCLASIGVASGLTPEDKLRELTPWLANDISGIRIKATA